jgi:hypothetical protein
MPRPEFHFMCYWTSNFSFFSCVWLLIGSACQRRSYLRVKDKNLSEQSIRVVLSLWTNVRDLDLSNNNIRILPDCLNRCQIEVLRLVGCKYLEEIRGIPSNLKGFFWRRMQIIDFLLDKNVESGLLFLLLLEYQLYIINNQIKI